MNSLEEMSAYVARELTQQGNAEKRRVQEIFDTVAKHLLQQGVPAIENGQYRCRYRTTTGLKCAVGCLIPDDVYRPFWEEQNIAYIPWFERNFKGAAYYLLFLLQDAHDTEFRWQGIEAWRLRMRHIADVNGLSAEVLN